MAFPFIRLSAVSCLEPLPHPGWDLRHVPGGAGPF
jgi:hypothetical protein